MRIDNRTTSIRLLNRPDDVTETSLQSFFGSFGVVESVVMVGNSAAIVKYAERYMAEKAMAGAKVLGETPLKLEWYDPRLTGGGNSTTPTTTKTGAAEIEPPPEPYAMDEDDGLEDEVDYQEDLYEDLDIPVQGVA